MYITILTHTLIETKENGGGETGDGGLMKLMKRFLGVGPFLIILFYFISPFFTEYLSPK